MGTKPRCLCMDLQHTGRSESPQLNTSSLFRSWNGQIKWCRQVAARAVFRPKGQQHTSPGQRRCAALEASPPPRVQEPHWSQALKERHKNPHAEVVSLLQSSGIYHLVYPGRHFVRLAPDSALPRAGLFLACWAAPHAAVAARQYATARRPCQQGVISRNGST